MTRGGDHFVFAQIGAARPARAADFPIEQIPLRADRWRSGGRAVRSYRVAAHRRRPPAHGPGGSTSCSRFDISGWRDRGLYPLVQGRRGARGESTASMTRGGGHFVFAQIGAARPARVADFRFSNFRCGPHRWRSGGRAVRSYRVAAHRRRPRANGPGGSTPSSRFDISGWRDRGLYRQAAGPASTVTSARCRCVQPGGHDLDHCRAVTLEIIAEGRSHPPV